MKTKRFTIGDTNGDGYSYGYDVIDEATGEKLAHFSHEWRAIKFIEEAENSAKKRGESILVESLHNTKGEIVRRILAD